jgi:hypothetical protein
MANGGHVFTVDHEQYLRDASQTKVSYKQMALDFNVRFGTRLTRNSILGKCSRLGLRNVKTPSRHMQVRRAKRTASLNKSRVAAVRSQSPAPDHEALLRPDGRLNRLTEGATRVRKEFGGIDGFHDDTIVGRPFLDLRRGECRWPVTNDASRACGAKACVGSYCTAHAQLAYRTMPTVSRNRKILAGSGYLDTELEVTHMLESGGVQAPSLIPSFLPSKEST